MKNILVVQGGGRSNGKPQIDKTNCLQRAYEFGKHIYED